MVVTAHAPGVRGGTLASHARGFGRHASPWVLVGLVAGLWGARAFLGPVQWSDLAVVAAIVAVEPVVEWLIHSWILHARPWEVLGRTMELSAAKGHRRHHEDPTDLSLVFLPAFTLIVVVPVLAVGAFLLVRPAHLAATAVATSTAALLAYEWVHYLIHTSYKPRRRYYRHLWRHHHLHHYRNEGYWYGVTTCVGDVLLGTCPRGGAVPVSPTARTLGKPMN